MMNILYREIEALTLAQNSNDGRAGYPLGTAF